MRVKNRIRECKWCKKVYELGVDGGMHRYCSIPCRKAQHYNKWSAPGMRKPEYMKNRRLVQEFGISLEDFKAMLEDQERKCPCCSKYLSGGRNTHVDHCHSSGKVRSLLCQLCNQALGLVREDTTTLNNMIEYLELHRGS